MDRIEELIESKGITKTWLAGQMGISRTWLYRLLNGEEKWSKEHREKAALALGVPVAFLFAEDVGEKPAPEPARAYEWED